MLQPPALVDTAALAAHLTDADLRLLDCTFLLPPHTRDLAAEFAACHLPGARRFDIDAVSDHTSPLPHMLPTPDDFAVAVGELGIGNAQWVVLYDESSAGGASLAGSARAWWMFRVFGHCRVSVLDGGLPAWRAAGLPLTAVPTPVQVVPYVARPRAELVWSRAQVTANVAARARQLVDARSVGRFAGTEPEPRAGLRGGHIDGAFNVPFTAVLDVAARRYSDLALTRSAFEAAGIDLTRPIATSCGSGVTACVLALALHRLGIKEVPVYDGAWAEWGAIPA